MNWHVAQSFEPVPGEVASVRRFIAEVAGGWGLETGDLVLVANELAANAVLHARSPFTVGLSSDGTRVRVEVSDLNSRRPVAEAVPLSAFSGRGLMIVNVLASRWGVEAGEGEGKTVWAELQAARAAD